MRLGGRVDHLPRGGPGAMTDDAAAAQHDMGRLAEAMPQESDRILAAFLRDHLAQEVREVERFWYRFPVTPFNMLHFSTYREQVLGAMTLSDPAEVEHYLGLLDDYVAVVAELRVTLEEQRRRGITLPGWAMDSVLDTVREHADACVDLVPAQDRLAELSAGSRGRLVDAARRAVAGPLVDAFAAVLDELNACSPAQGVGIGQYAGGGDCYAGLVGLHTGLDLAPDRVHAIGVEEVARLTERIRMELGVLDEAEYRARLTTGRRAEPADVEALFQGYLDRLVPHLPDYFAVLPSAPFRLRRLDPVLEGGLTYGYYEPPGADGCGYYHYNGANPPMLQAATLIYHEGMPGHHLQIGRQAENSALHPIQREPTGLRTFALNGYLEGWAEYAAGLCEEIGLYTDPADAYGRLCMERFQAARLVVDTGMNVMDWSRERAAAYLRDTTLPARGRDQFGTDPLRRGRSRSGTQLPPRTLVSPPPARRPGSDGIPRDGPRRGTTTARSARPVRATAPRPNRDEPDARERLRESDHHPARRAGRRCRRSSVRQDRKRPPHAGVSCRVLVALHDVALATADMVTRCHRCRLRDWLPRDPAR